MTESGQQVRLTHIIRPAIINPRPLPSGSLVTPDNSDLSAPSSSDLSSGSGTENETESDSDTATEMGDSIHDITLRPTGDGDESDNDAKGEGEGSEVEVEGYTLIPPAPREVDSTLGMRSPTLESAMDELRVSELSLSRTYSNSSSQYASSEGTTGSEYGMGMADSLTLPPMPQGGTPTSSGTQGWVSTFDNGPIDLGAAPISGLPSRKVQPVGGAGRKGWQDKPTFFEYLYGA